jgi:hypothetical protein
MPMPFDRTGWCDAARSKERGERVGRPRERTRRVVAEADIHVVALADVPSVARQIGRSKATTSGLSRCCQHRLGWRLDLAGRNTVVGVSDRFSQRATGRNAPSADSVPQWSSTAISRHHGQCALPRLTDANTGRRSLERVRINSRRKMPKLTGDS